MWDAEGLSAGTRPVRLLVPLLLAAALLWPMAVLLSRISVRGATVAGAVAGSAAAVRGLGRRVRDAVPSIGGLDPDNAPPPPSPPPRQRRRRHAADVPRSPTEEASPCSSLDELLARKRRRQS